MKAPDLHRLWEGFLRIGPCRRSTFEHGLHVEKLRHAVVPLIRTLRSEGVVDWFFLMIHDDVTFPLDSGSRQDALWHLRFSLADSATNEELSYILNGRLEGVKPVQAESVMSLGVISPGLLKSNSIADDWLVLGLRTEFLLTHLEQYRDDADPAAIARELRHFEHLFENSILPQIRVSPELKSIAPQFQVLNLAEACVFYVHKLGFHVAFTYGDFYAGVERDGVMIHLKLVDQPDPSRQMKRSNEHLDAYIYVRDAAKLYTEFQGRGVVLDEPLRATEWGTMEFVVCDNNGYILHFAQLSE